MWFMSYALPLFLAVGLPFALLVSRSVVRSQRGALYNDLITALFPEGGSEALPQLELVRSKYDSRKGRDDGADTVKNVHRSPQVMVLTTVLFAAQSFMGFSLLLTPKVCLLQGVCSSDGSLGTSGNFIWFMPNAFLWSSAALTDGVFNQDATNTIVVASLGFLGAYVAAAQYLIRQLLNYELEAVSFLRSAFQLGMGVIVSVVAYRALASGVDLLVGRVASKSMSADWWLGAAFLIGMAPQTGLSWLSSKLKLSLQKQVDLTQLDAAKIIPVEVIEGINTETKVRLDQSNITDVQNLATRNPIELYIETPFGLLEVFDWVLQAQLCTVVGVNAYDALKKHNIRTIFDLERAILAERVPDSYVEALGEVIYANAQDSFKARIRRADGSLDADVIRHGVAVVCDDLHVHRLRALWKRILYRSMPPGDDAWLYRTTALPGDLTYGLPSATPIATHYMGLAAAWGREHAARRAAGEQEAKLEDMAEAALTAATESVRRDPAETETLRRLLDADPTTPEARADLAQFHSDSRFRSLLDPQTKFERTGGAKLSARAVSR